MKRIEIKHWQDPVSALVGAWLILSPWLLGVQGDLAALANALALGALLLATALGAIFVPRAWEEWTEIALGAWLFISPWALRFDGLEIPTVATAAAGLLVVMLAVWVLMVDESYAAWWKEGPTAQ
jgi:hypothetical protein